MNGRLVIKEAILELTENELWQLCKVCDLAAELDSYPEGWRRDAASYAVRFQDDLRKLTSALRFGQ